MAKGYRVCCYVLFVAHLFWTGAYGQPVLRVSEAELRARVVQAQAKYLTVRENRYKGEKGQWVYTNRGLELDAIQRRAGCPLGCFWCGAYQVVLFADVGIDVRKDFRIANPLAVRDWFAQKKKVVYVRGNGNQRVGIMPQRGDVMRMFASHIEMYIGDDWLKDYARKKIPSGGGNTGGGRGWHGVYITERNAAEIQVVANYITPYCNEQLSIGNK